MLLIGLVPVSMLFPADKVLDATEVWEKALRAKGGRQVLDAVQSLNESIEFRLSFGMTTIPAGQAETLYVFPDREWQWTDGRRYSPKLLPKIWVTQLDRAMSWVASSYSDDPSALQLTALQVKGSKRGLTKVQLGLLLKSGIEPLQLTKAMERRTVSGCKLLLNGSVGEEMKVEFEFDCKTFLASRMTLTYPLPPDFPKPTKLDSQGHLATNPTEVVLTQTFSDYKPVAGVMLPHTVTTRNSRTTINKVQYRINPEYDKNIFEIPPSTAIDRFGWKLRPQ